MSEQASHRFGGCVITFLLGFGLTPAGLAETPGARKPLAALIPDDVCAFTACAHNAERDFLDRYWGEVFEAVRESGIGPDVVELVGTFIPESEQEQIDELKELASKLIAGVNWSGLVGGETAFAMRPMKVVQFWSNVMMPPPDEVWLFRGSVGLAAENFTGLVAILDAMAEQINGMLESEVMKVEKGEQFGARTASLDLLAMIPVPGLSMKVSVAHRGDMIVIALGERMLTDVLALMDGKGKHKPLIQSPRYKAALAKLPAAEDSFSFFDVKMLVGGFRTIADDVFKAIDSGKIGGDYITNKNQSAKANELNAKAIAAYRVEDYPKALKFIELAHEEAPNDSLIMYNVACFSALLGQKKEALNWLEKSVAGGFYAPHQISNDSDLESLRQEKQYKEALALATERAGAHRGESADAKLGKIKIMADLILDIPAMIDYTACVETTEGHSTHTRSVVVLSADASEHAFFPVFGKRKPITAFDRFLPKETTSFSVSNGIDLGALYTFLEDAVRGLGPDGEAILAEWEAMQEQMEFDVRKDVIDLIDGETISVSLDMNGREGSVLMIKVTDEAETHERLNCGIDFLSAKLKELATKNPMLAMLALRSMPTTHERLEGFKDVYFGMTPQPFTCGVANGYLVLGTPADAVALCLATGAGEHPRVTKNERVMAEALVPKGPVTCISYTDERKFGTQLATALGMISMSGQMATMAIPNPQAQRLVGKLMGIVGKLGTIATKLDFYKSSASATTFDGKVFSTHSVTHYINPETRSASAMP